MTVWASTSRVYWLKPCKRFLKAKEGAAEFWRIEESRRCNYGPIGGEKRGKRKRCKGGVTGRGRYDQNAQGKLAPGYLTKEIWIEWG